jgi:uncharacterized protein
MRIFIDIAHPAYFHFLRNFIEIMESKGHDFFISAKDKDVTIELLNHYSIKYYNRGKAANRPIGKVFNIIKNDLMLYNRVRRFAPDLVVSFSSPIAAHVAFLLRKSSITIEDTECAGVVQKSYLPFSQVVLTPSCFKKRLGRKQLVFDAYKELAYLHPNYFKVDTGIRGILNLRRDERYVIVRFVSHTALHDFGEHGLADGLKVKLVEQLSKFARVFITSEYKLPEQLEPYRIAIPSREMHNVLSDAVLLVGESATMAAEAAMLGIPAIFIDSQGRGYTDELEERYNLVYNFKSDSQGFGKAICKALELLEMPDTRERFRKNRDRILKEKIDITAFLVWFVENYPESVKVMRENPDYQYKFK